MAAMGWNNYDKRVGFLMAIHLGVFGRVFSCCLTLHTLAWLRAKLKLPVAVNSHGNFGLVLVEFIYPLKISEL